MNPKIVIIDDEQLILESLTEVMIDEGYDVKSFDLPTKALDYILAQDDLACIICDINMPELNGMELFEKFRKAGKLTPFIFNSGHIEFIQSAAALIEKYPPCSFICKPDLTLIQKVKETIEKAK